MGGYPSEIGYHHMVEQLLMAVAGLDKATFHTKKIEQFVDCSVHNINVNVTSEDFLLYSGFQQLQSDAKIADTSRLRHIFIYFRVIFFEIMKEDWI